MEVTVLVTLVDSQYERETKLPLVAVSVKNVSDCPTGIFEVMFEYDEAVGQDCEKQYLIFDTAPHKIDAPLKPGEARTYYLHRKWMPTLEGIIASLPPKRYRLVSSRPTSDARQRVESNGTGMDCNCPPRESKTPPRQEFPNSWVKPLRK